MVRMESRVARVGQNDQEARIEVAKLTCPSTTTILAMAEPGPSSVPSEKKKPIVIITIGMAGAGKSTFVQRINSHLNSKNPPSPPYILNLDPAVTHVPFEPNIDIRDTVNYHEVMKQCVSSCDPHQGECAHYTFPQVQLGTQRRYFDRFEPLHHEVRRGFGSCREEIRGRRVRTYAPEITYC